MSGLHLYLVSVTHILQWHAYGWCPSFHISSINSISLQNATRYHSQNHKYFPIKMKWNRVKQNCMCLRKLSFFPLELKDSLQHLKVMQLGHCSTHGFFKGTLNCKNTEKEIVQTVLYFNSVFPLDFLPHYLHLRVSV